MYRLARDTGMLRKGTGRAEIVEWGATQQLLSTIILLLQQQIHATYTAQTSEAKKKARLNYWPTPMTAEQLVRSADVREAFHHLEDNVIRAVSAAEYEALIAADVGATEGGPAHALSVDDLRARVEHAPD